MTFTEAAIEVLKRTGKPLHYKKITELAIQLNLLSHVGKTPEVTMSSRLATLVKRERDESPIVKVKPGVFGLRDFGKEVIEAAAAELPDDPQAAAEEAALEARLLAEGAAAEDAASAETPGAEPEGGGDTAAAGIASAPGAAGPKKTAKPLPGQDVFPAEEDDDEPIFGGPEKDDDKAADKGGDREGRRRRRRRRRGGAEGGAEASAAEPGTAEPPRERGPDRGGDWDRDRAERDRHERERYRTDRGAQAPRAPEPPVGDPNREHADGELVGKELADAVLAVLAGLDRSPQPLLRVADHLVRRGRLAGDPAMLVPTVAAAIRADAARREAERMRPRFRLALGRVSLTDWSLPQEAVRFEAEAVRAADRQREQVRQAFLRRVRELPGAGFAELLATWLNAEGVVALRAVRRPGAQPGELHLAGTLRRGHEETRLAIVARRDGREITRERVMELRGALHHYGSASAAWMITLGQVLSGAREEAAVPGVPPVACFDGVGLSRAMERAGVGLVRHAIPLATLDLDLLESLRGDYPAAGAQNGERRDDARRDEARRDEPRREERGGRGRDRRERFRERERSEADARALAGDDGDEGSAEPTEESGAGALGASGDTASARGGGAEADRPHTHGEAASGAEPDADDADEERDDAASPDAEPTGEHADEDAEEDGDAIEDGSDDDLDDDEADLNDDGDEDEDNEDDERTGE
jgi:hypothetical protein